MPASARQRAEACFAVARSATFAGERHAAIGRGEAIAKRAGLDLDTFDIPGRPRVSRPAAGGRSGVDPLLDGIEPRSPMTPRWPTARDFQPFRPTPKTDGYTRAELSETMRRFSAHMAGLTDTLHGVSETLRRREAEVGAGPDETVYDARRRNFDDECRSAQERDRARASRL